MSEEEFEHKDDEDMLNKFLEDEKDDSEKSHSPFPSQQPEDPYKYITQEEDYELKKQYGVHVDYENFEPFIGKYDQIQINKGRDSYEEIKESQYKQKCSFYGEDKRELIAKRRFQADIDEAIGGTEKLGEIVDEADDIMENLTTPQFIKTRR